MDVKKFTRTFNRIVENVNTVIHGKDDVVRLSLTAICCGGHVLFEDVPGVGKSVLARALGQSFRAQWSRIQCTPDMLPGDITGSSIIDPKNMKFSFRPGPIFANVLLVDEINRATPKTQSALLEAMAERSVTVDGRSYRMPEPFLVLATQNPVELAGTFPLPEAQLDRFLFKLTMGYADAEAERLIMRGNAHGLEVESLQPVSGSEDILEMMAMASEVSVPTAVETYIIEIVQSTRSDPALTLGASPRASIFLSKASKVMAAADGRQHVYPEDVKALLKPIIGHRMMLTPDAVLRGETIDDVLERVVGRVKPPLGVGSKPAAAPGKVPSADDTGELPVAARDGARGRRVRTASRAR